MTNASELRSGKGHKDENFPVASRIIHPRHRPLILAFYNFVRTADDIADHANLSDQEKLGQLDRLQADLCGEGDGQPEALALRSVLAARAMSPQHALDVLTAFRMDVTKKRYETWDDLIHYCQFSAMPVGRFVLDVHGENRATWAASDRLCAALQINNHLQDCGKDYRNLDRVYVPLEALRASGVSSVEEFGQGASSAPLLDCLHKLAARNETLLADSRSLRGQVRDTRLGMEISIIDVYAEKIVNLLKTRDPLRDPVHLSKFTMLGLAASGACGELCRRALGRTSPFRLSTGA